MKNKNKLIPFIFSQITLLLVGGFAFATALNTSNKYEEVHANSSNTTSGLYKRVSDIGTLSVGDIVLLVDSDGNSPKEVVTGHNGGGTKAISKDHVLDNGGYCKDFDSDDDKQYLALGYSYAEEFSIQNGSSSGTYAFKSTQAFANNYIAYLGGNGLGSQNSINGATSWRFDVSDIDSYYFKLYNPANDIYFANAYENYGMNSYAYNAPQLSVYKKIENDFSIPNTCYTTPKQTTYYLGDTVNLSGLSVDILVGGASGDDVILKYDDAPGAFTFNQTISYTIKEQGYIEVLVIDYRNVNVNLNIPDHPGTTFTKVTSPLSDYRGTYLLVYEDENDSSKNAIFNSTLGNDKIDDIDNFTRDFSIFDGVISNLSYVVSQMTIRVVRETVDGVSKYFLKTPNDQYLTFEWNYSAQYGQHGIKGVDTVIKDEDNNIYSPDDVGQPISFFETNTTIMMTFGDHWTDLYFNFADNGDYSYFEFREGSHVDRSYEKDVSLYKMNLDEDIGDEINTFKTSFFSTTSVCDANGATNNITAQMWSDLADEFNALSEDAKGYIASLTYTHNAETAGSENDMVDRYDYIVSKYDTLNDFMNRKDVTTYQNNYNARPMISSFFNGINNEIKQNNAVVILIITIVLSISSVGFYFLLKRKHQ